jgi:hypothetical protein
VDILEKQRLDELSAWRKDELSLARSLAEQAADGAARRYLWGDFSDDRRQSFSLQLS